MAMAKPQQGIFITSDSKALLSTNFIDLRLDANFETAFDTGLESIDWISHPDLKNIFAKLEWFNTENNQKKTVGLSFLKDGALGEDDALYVKGGRAGGLQNLIA